MASDILHSFEDWLNSVTDEELLEALREVDADLFLAQQEVDMELYSERCHLSVPKVIYVEPPSGYSADFSDILIEAA